jgi:NADPH:quinone reductase
MNLANAIYGLFSRRLRIGAMALGYHTTKENQAAWWGLLKVLADTGSRPLIEHVFPFEQLTQAFERLAGGPMGKVAVKVKPQG